MDAGEGDDGAESLTCHSCIIHSIQSFGSEGDCEVVAAFVEDKGSCDGTCKR